ncbi:MAG: HAMP domain-containing histidine kinase, partial [Epsilonproteobacteria bacterium]|nr:HAMP domain-containing histidine kinase [Campylobacterota bacterium]
QMGQVVNMIAHQWKGPLNTLSLLNEKLNICQGMEKLDSDKMDEFQKNSRQQIRQMSEVINDFSNFFKADKEKVSFNLMQVVKNAVEVLEPMLKEKQIEVNIEMVSGVKLLLEEGYPNKLAQAITNVVRNAKDALAQQSDNHNRWIKIRLETKERKTYLHIEDNAGGITQENINRVFDPYFSTKMQKYGTGLGLYIAKIIVEEHKGGELEVTNGNHGAHFTMTFSVAL